MAGLLASLQFVHAYIFLDRAMEARSISMQCSASFKALHDPNSPASINVQLKEDRRPLRNQITNVGPTIEYIDHLKTFRASAASVFNDLPKKTRENLSLDSFKNETKIYLLEELRLLI